MRLMEHWWPALMGAGEGSRTVYHEGYRAAVHGLHQACRAYSHYSKTQNCFFKNEWVLSQYSALNCRRDLPGWRPFTLFLVKTLWFFMGKLPLFLGEILSLGGSSRVGHPGNYVLLATVTGSGMGMWPDPSEGNSVLGNSWKKRNSVEVVERIEKWPGASVFHHATILGDPAREWSQQRGKLSQDTEKQLHEELSTWIQPRLRPECP